VNSLSGLFADAAPALIVLPEEPRRHAEAYGYDCCAALLCAYRQSDECRGGEGGGTGFQDTLS
jgi:hypothetical protein